MVLLADIIGFGDKYKRILKIGLGWIRKKLGGSPEIVYTDLTNCGNPVFHRMFHLLEHTANNVREPYQRDKVLKDVGFFMLWVIYKDTAYRDIIIYMLNEILKNPEVWKKELAPYLKENPEDWYVNVWNKSKEHTKQLRKEGKIDGVSKSEDESVFTPEEQAQKLKKYE